MCIAGQTGSSRKHIIYLFVHIVRQAFEAILLPYSDLQKLEADFCCEQRGSGWALLANVTGDAFMQGATRLTMTCG
jgi:hypothetical protein